MRKLTLALLLLAAVLLPRDVLGAPANDRVVVLISLDGLAGYYLDDPKAEMPTIRRLMAEGARAASMRASTPSVTWPNHTTLVTGVHPARHGVVGNNYYDRTARKHVALIGDAEFDKEQIVRAATIYDVAHKAGLRTASVRWPATRSAKTLDWQMPDVGTFKLLKRYMTPELQSELAAAGLWAEFEEAEKREKDGRWLPPDELCTKMFNLILKKHRPNIALLHLFEVDHVQHRSGPRSPEAYAAIREADARVRAVWETLKKEYPAGRSTLIIASDHGFSPINRIILPNVVLRKAKLLNQSGDGGDDDRKPLVRVIPQGGCAMLYILDDAKRDETVERIKAAFAGIEEIEKVVGPEETSAYGVARPADDPHAPDVLLFAKLGYAFGDTAAGDLPFEMKPERKGSHGHDPAIPELRASFVAWGGGIKPGSKLGDIENTDVTPTIAKLLGLEMPGLDGKALDEIIAPTPAAP